MLEKWRSLKVQGRLVRRFPKQVIDLGKLAWKWAIERVDGRAWVYFIFLVCDWLPTNLRRNKHSDMKEQCVIFVNVLQQKICHMSSLVQRLGENRMIS